MTVRASIQRTSALLAIVVLVPAAAGCGTDVVSRLLPPEPSAGGTGSDNEPDAGSDTGLDTWPARADGADGRDGAAIATDPTPPRRRVRVYRIGPSTYLITNEPWPPQAADRDVDRDADATATEGVDP